MRRLEKVLLFAALLFPASLEAQAPGGAAPAGEGKVSLRFVGTSLKEVLRVFEQYTGKRFLFDESATAGKRVNLLSNTPVPADRLMDVLENILEVEGLTLVETGKPPAVVYKVVPAAGAAGKAARTFTREDLENMSSQDRVVTLVFQLKYLPAEKVRAAFRNMTTLPDGIRAVEGTNLLVITDYASNVKRLGEILSSLDVPGPRIVRETVKLKHADPMELVREIRPLLDIENRVYLARLQRRMEERLRRVLGKRGGGRPASLGSALTGGTGPLAVIPVPRLGSVIISAVEEKLEELRSLVRSLDVADPEEKVVRFYPLRFQDPLSLAATLQRIFDPARLGRGGKGGRGAKSASSPGTLTIVPDPLSNQLVLVGSRKRQEEAAGVIEKLDSLSRDDRVLRFHPLRFADPMETASLLARLFGLQEAAGGRAGIRALRGGRKGGLRRGAFQGKDLVAADEELRTLLVLALPEIQDRIAAVLKSLDVEGPGRRKVRFYPLENARAVDVAKALTVLFGGSRRRPARRPGGKGAPRGGGLEVVADEKGNSLAVLGTDEEQARAAQVIRNLDARGSGMLLEYYPVRKAKVEEIAAVLGGLFHVEVGTPASLAALRAPRGGRRGAPLPDTPLLVPDAGLKALVVRAPRRLQEEIARALKRLDVEGPGLRVTKYYKIENTSVTEVADTLRSLFAGTGAGRGRGRWRKGAGGAEEVIVVPNEELSTVTVSAPEEIHEKIALVVRNLDVPSVKDNVLRYYPVRHADLEEAADTVSKVFALTKGDDRRLKFMAGRSARGRNAQRSPFTDQKVVIADHNTSSLLVVAPREMQEEVASLLERIDVSGAGGRVVKYYKVARSSVREVAATVASIFDMDLATPQRRVRIKNPDRPARSVVIPNEALGMVIVVAPGDVQERVGRMIESLDTGGPDENELRYYRIEKVDIVEAANIISQIYGINLGSVDQPYRQRGRRPASELLTKERVVIPNRDLGTILVAAPRKIQEEIADTIKRIDVRGTRENVFRMYDVTAAEVQTSAQTISRLFDIPIMTSRSVRPRPGRGPVRGAKITTEPFLIPDEQLGSLIVNAPEEIHREIKTVLEKLTTIGRLEKMTIRFYKLKNTDAQEVAAKIGNLFNITLGTPEQLANRSARRTTRGGAAVRRGRTEAPGEKEQGRGGGAAPEEQAPASEPSAGEPRRKAGRQEFYFEGESVVIPDSNLNSIILIAPDYIHKEVEKVLKTIDVRRPQVLFEVAILDVSSGGALNLGTEFTTIDRQGASKLRGHGFSNFGIASRKGSDQGGFPDKTYVPGDVPGLFIGVSKGKVGNIPFLIRLLKENNDVNIRSTPLLLVNDNQQAVFSSLEEQPTTTTSQGTATTKISFGGFVEAGTILTITPHVSEGNYIRVDIDLKVENFHGESPAPGIPPPRASNQLTTSITVPDNRTVVIGGLATTKKTKVTRGVPILKDIPLLGLLFSYLSEEEQTTRLYLFLRPQILNDVDFKDLKRISREKNLEAHGLTGRSLLPDKASPSSEGEEGAPASRPSREKEERP